MNRLIYFFLIVLFSAEGYLLNNRFGYTPLLFLILLFPVDDICAICAWRKTSGGTLLPSFQEYGRGKPASFSCAFENKSHFLISRLRVTVLLTGPDRFRPLKKTVSLSIAPNSTETLRFSFLPGHVGAYRATMRKAVVSGPLGIFKLRLRTELRPAAAVVTPGRSLGQTANPDVLSLRREEGLAKGHGRYDENSYDGVREYVPGDSMRSIHWKLSAHSRKMMTRLYEETGAACSTVAVDFRPVPTGSENALFVHDLLCEMAYREVLSRVGRGESVRLVSCGGKPLCREPIHTEKGLADAAVSLALAKKESEEMKIGIFQSGHGGAAAVAACLDENLARELAAQTENGADAVYCYAAPVEKDVSAFSEKLAQCGVSFLQETAAAEEEPAARIQISRE